MKKTIAFIGVGNMGSAILNGMLQSQSFSAEDIIVFDTDEHKCHPFTEMGCCYASDTVSAVSKADVVLLAVKPQLIDSVMEGFVNKFPEAGQTSL